MKHLISCIVLILVLLDMSSLVSAQVDLPDPPVLESASVVYGANPSEVVLQWIPSDSLDVEGYIVYQVIGGVTETIDTVYGRLSNTYTNTNSSANINVETYRLAAFDTLEFKSMITNPHTTVFLNSSYQQCARDVQLNWSEYLGWEEGVYQYSIFRKSENGSYALLGTTNGDITTYLDENVGAGINYCYYVEAVNHIGITASSNQNCILTISYDAPEYLNANYASVVDGNVEVSFSVDELAEVVEYKLLKSHSAEFGFTELARFPDTGQNVITYTDQNVHTQNTKFYYKLASIDPCGNTSAESNLASNIVLVVSGDDNLYLNHYLSWTPYEDWLGGVDDYRVYRVFTDGAPILLDQSGFTIRTFTVDVDWYVNCMDDSKQYVTNKFCYLIEAYENELENPWGFHGVSRSNVACFKRKPLIWIPTVFNPGSYVDENREFKPVISFAEQGAYRFVIFDRLGMAVFETHDISMGWDGILGDKRAPCSTYTYYLRYIDFNGDEYLHTGLFLLITE